MWRGWKTAWLYAMVLLLGAAAQTDRPKAVTTNHSPANAEPQANRTPDRDETFARRVCELDAFIMDESKLVLLKSENPSLERYAQMMLDDHSGLEAELGRGVDPPATKASLGPRLAAMYSRAEALETPAFEKQFVNDMISTHEELTREMDAEIESGSQPELKKAATLNRFQMSWHLERARRLADALSLAMNEAGH